MRVWLVGLLLLAACPKKGLELAMSGEVKAQRERPLGLRPNAPETAPVLVLALDGVSRELLYEMVRAGKLPNIEALLGGDHLSHAYFDDSFLSTLPSTTMAAWVTTFTGVTPAEHGVTGNEYFIRETRTLACPAPVQFADSNPTLEIYTDGYINKLTDSPTVYERIHEQDPDTLIWVGMSQVYRGADWLLLAKRVILVKAFEGFFVKLVESLAGSDADQGKIYKDLDNAAIDVVTSHLEQGPIPDVLTVYVSGTDLLAHIAKEGPDEARRKYLAEIVDTGVGKIVDVLRRRDALANRWVIITADHGHTPVVHDDVHAIMTVAADVLTHAGFRVRKFAREVPATDPFNAVLAFGGAMAYVYIADRGQCAGEHDACPWGEPARYEQDVLAAADAFYRANEDGTGAPGMKGALDLILTRQPKPVKDIDLPFEVYLGNGKTQPIDAYLKDHPHPTYIAMAERFHDLAVGLHGERAGDVLLIAHNGDREKAEERFYFAAPYRSWHGSPSRDDSQIPLIVARSIESSKSIEPRVKRVLGDRPFQQKVTDLILDIRRKDSQPKTARSH
ncbi:MAG: hypothetical protein JWO36_1219 [Myxococcales bacterium]|nr:hypothetical protein [Myxococcales bacterium]